MRSYQVWLFDQLVGHLQETRKGARFAYVPEVVESHAGAPLLSLSLPAKARPYAESKTENWFSGLLPEGERRVELCRELGINQYDWLGLLGEIGWECAGAVRVFPEGQGAKPKGSYEALERRELAERLANVSTRAVHYEEGTYRLSLGGFQDKLCVAMARLDADEAEVAPEEVFLPVGDAPSTHILKPEPRAYPGLPASEAWAMTAAAQAARCSGVALLALKGAPQTLVVERYDRAGTAWPNDIQRLHQEDGCQALGIAPEDKYASSPVAKGNDPTYRALAGLLMRYAEHPAEELDELFRQMVVNYVLGNWDAHAKNVSFLYEKLMVPAVAPLYDVVPIADVEKRTNLMSLRIDGLLKPEDVTRSSIVSESKDWGIAGAHVEELLEGCLANLRKGLEAAKERYPEAAKRHTKGAKQRMAKLVK